MRLIVEHVAQLLADMEFELRQLGLWELEAPSPEALASTIPFCFDTLHFHQWLQWIFLPRIEEILAGKRPWPATSDILPIAEHSFAGKQLAVGRLLELIKQFDSAISDRVPDGGYLH